LSEIPKSARDKRVERDEAEHDVAKPNVCKQIVQSHAFSQGARRKSAGAVCGDTDDRQANHDLKKKEEPELAS